MIDTTVAVQRRYDEMFGALTQSERLRMVSGMFDTGRRLATAGILRDEPEIDPVDLQRRLFIRFYGDDFSPSELERIFNTIPRLRREP